MVTNQKYCIFRSWCCFYILCALGLLQIVNIRKRKIIHMNECEGFQRKSETTHLAFLKVHKTASTTVQNLFLRFGQSRNLTFILPHDKADLAEIDYLPNVISVKVSLTDKNIVPPPNDKHYDILCCHVIYDNTKFKRYLPRDTLYLGLVREPTERLESAFAFFGNLRGTNLSDYAVNPYSYYHFIGSMTNNRMAFAFGFPSALFPRDNSSNFTEGNKIEAYDYLAKLYSEFDLIMIHEKLNHSMVLMKRILQWHVKDTIFINRYSRSKNKRRFLESEKANIMSYLRLDYLLYDFALIEFNRKIDSMSDDFSEEVKQYVKIIEQASIFCQDDTITSIHIPASKWDSSFNLTKTDCDEYIKPEIRFIREIRMRQYGQLNI